MMVIVPSRRRPQRAAGMAASARDTAAGEVRVLVVVDPDDPELADYRRKVKDLLVLPERLGYSGSLNYVAQMAWDDHEILGAFGDDVLFRTPGWDVKVGEALATPGIAFGDDLAHHESHPTAVFMSSEIAKALGYLALPKCRHQYVDNAWWELGTALGVLRYLPEVVVEHMHPAYQKAELDVTYREVYSQPQAGKDRRAFLWWKRRGGLDRDAAKVRAALETKAAWSEGRFTKPRKECPRPDWWHSSDDDSTEWEVSELVGAFVRALQPEIVVETGTAWGQTAQHIGHALQANHHGHLYTTEVVAERAATARERCAGLPVTVLEQESLTFTPPGPVGFAWFDSLIPLRVEEARALRPWLKPGAIVGFHDCGPQHDLRPAVEELAGEGWLRPIYLPTPRGVIFAEVLG